MLDDPTGHIHDALGVSMGRIDDDDINPGLSELFHTAIITLAARHGCCHAKSELIVAVGRISWVFDNTLNISKAIKTDYSALFINEREFADFLSTHKLISFLKRSTGLSGQELSLHKLFNLHRVHRRKPHVARSNHTNETFFAIENRKTVEIDFLLCLDLANIGNIIVFVEANRAVNETVKVIFHLGHFSSLIRILQIFVDYTNTTRESHRNRHGRFSYRVHRSRKERHFHLHAAGKARL